MASQVLQFIGKGQVTIPQEWRALLGLEDQALKATLQGNKIILELFSLDENREWTVEPIALNELPASDRKIVREGRKAYKKGKKGAFFTASEFFKH